MISIIVPVYNVERYLYRSVKSIINQNYRDIEVILVDDGSTDDSGRLCDEIAKEDPRIKVIHQQNGGLSDARNRGLDIAAGEYIGFVDSDDWIAEDMYDTLYKLIVESNAEIAFCQSYIATDDSLYEKRTEKGNIQIYSVAEAVKWLISGEISTSACDKLYKRSVLETCLFPKGRYFEDMFSMAQMFSRCTKIVSINTPLYYYYRRDGSICYTSSIKHFQDHYDASLIRHKFVADHFADLKLISEMMHISFISRLQFDVVRMKYDKECESLCNTISNDIKHYPFKELFRLPIKRLPSVIIIRYFPLLIGLYLSIEKLYSKLFISMNISKIRYQKIR